ncbi:MAG: histone deacetylase [Deltaproteobacteria bacterium]|nr:histone deacetylase [Deltaproteobacteria bacterium]
MLVGVVRDRRFLDHKTGLGHPEQPARLAEIYRALDWDFPTQFQEFTPRSATLEELERVHTPAYTAAILASAHRRFTILAPDTHASAASCLAAWLSAGACLTGLEALLAGQVQACFALVRPPGHHALPDRGEGFCLFNNLAITARHAQVHFGLKRILIVDWDVHHGNGIQEVFYQDPGVFYLSTHDLHAFPWSGNWDETGHGPGRGYTVNVPIVRHLADDDLVGLYADLLPAVIKAYRPQLILGAAGFDAHHRDPLGCTKITSEGHHGVANLLASLGPVERGIPLLLSLEGGYDPRALTKSVVRVLEALLEPRPYTTQGRHPSELAAELARRARKSHAAYKVWTG